MGALRRTATPVAALAAGVSIGTYAGTASTSGGEHAIDTLWNTVESRRGTDPKTSWTAKLLSKGVPKCAQKVGEEATEVVIEAVAGNHEGVVKESADLLYHLAVLWAASGVKPDEVYAELKRREGVSGITEKASRPKQ